MKPRLAFSLIAAVALGAGALTYQRLFAAVEKPALTAFTLADTDGKQHSVEEWQGKVLLINFWATWCTPCRKEIPELNRLQQEFGQKGLQILGIAIDDSESVKAFMGELPMGYPVLIAEDEGIPLAMQLGNQLGVLPFSVIVDRGGKISGTHTGLFSREQILKIVEPLLG